MTEKQSHTPGPWRVSVHSYWLEEVEIFDFNVVDKEGQIVVSPPFDQPKNEADAHLIAAAPELFECGIDVEELLDFIVELEEETVCVSDLHQFLNQIFEFKAALRKAEGREVRGR